MAAGLWRAVLRSSSYCCSWQSCWPTAGRTALLQRAVQFRCPGHLAAVATRAYVSKPSYPPLVEDELEESFVRGSGPGGQAVNMTSNCVVLKHVPTGIVVKCHETRSVAMNRQRARARLQEKLDLHYNGEQSYVEQQRREEARKLKEKKRRSQAHQQKLKAFREREGLID